VNGKPGAGIAIFLAPGPTRWNGGHGWARVEQLADFPPGYRYAYGDRLHQAFDQW
jgi:hypothetical protein